MNRFSTMRFFSTFRPRIPPKPTKEYLYRVGLNYLSRFSSSENNLQRILERRAVKAAQHHGVDVEQTKSLIPPIVSQFVSMGAINDETFGNQLAKSLFQRGNPLWQIKSKLRAKGISEKTADSILLSMQESGDCSSLLSAILFAKRKKMGPFREKRSHETDKKDLRKFGAAGFHYVISRQVLDLQQEELQMLQDLAARSTL